jgi:hypothetical protein
VSYVPLRRPAAPGDFDAAAAGNITVELHHDCGGHVAYVPDWPLLSGVPSAPLTAPRWVCSGCGALWTPARVKELAQAVPEMFWQPRHPEDDLCWLVWTWRGGRWVTALVDPLRELVGCDEQVRLPEVTRG